MNDDDMELNAGADKLAPASAAVCSLYDATCNGDARDQMATKDDAEYPPEIEGRVG